MKKHYLMAVLLLMVAGMQTAWAQSMRVNLAEGKSLLFSVKDVESVTFSETDVAEGYEYVDLDLPSGTLWATCNVGADRPEAYGNYYAWAETETKDAFGWDSYKYGTSTSSIKKYTISGSYYSVPDYLIRLLPEDDAATANWGAGWQMPSQAQFEELLDENYTTSEWTTQNDVNGLLITSKQNNRSVFLPAAGYNSSNHVIADGSTGQYWTRLLHTTNTSLSGSAKTLRFSSSASRIGYVAARATGLSIRPVRVKGKNDAPVCEYVDLGLPSGTLWATCNVGASSPDQRGDYFAWGETETKQATYSWDNYVFYNPSTDAMTKYNLQDDDNELNPEDDAATANWGEDWQMPSKVQMEELMNDSYTTKNWVQQGESYGVLLKSKVNGNSIFLPATDYNGADKNGSLPTYFYTRFGFYWSRDAEKLKTSNGMMFDSNMNFNIYEFDRYYGHCVRPVRTNPHAAVDLGLPSGTLWATCNIGAAGPEESGDYFAWGETETKKTYKWENYKFYGGFNDDALVNTVTKYNQYEGWGVVDGKTELDPEDDAATANWGELWQMPSMEQFEELVNPSYTTSSWTTISDVKVRKITSKKNGNSIYLPAAGLKSTTLMNNGSQGLFWSRMLYTGNPTSARYLTFYTTSDTYDTGYGLMRSQGLPVRAVRKP